MKKLILATLMLVSFLSGCEENTGVSNEKSNNTSSTREVSDMGTINFIEIELVDIDWNKMEFTIDPKDIEIPVDANPILTKEDAFYIGESIIQNCWNNNKFSDYVMLTVVHYTANNIWRFDYSIDQRNKDVNDLIDCGGFYVAIGGNDCKIIKAWIDE